MRQGSRISIYTYSKELTPHSYRHLTACQELSLAPAQVRWLALAKGPFQRFRRGIMVSAYPHDGRLANSPHILRRHRAQRMALTPTALQPGISGPAG